MVYPSTQSPRRSPRLEAKRKADAEAARMAIKKKKLISKILKRQPFVIVEEVLNLQGLIIPAYEEVPEKFYLSACSKTGYSVDLKDAVTDFETKPNRFITSFSMVNEAGPSLSIDGDLQNAKTVYLSGYILFNCSDEIDYDQKEKFQIGPIIKRYYKSTFPAEDLTAAPKIILETDNYFYTLIEPSNDYSEIWRNTLNAMLATQFCIRTLFKGENYTTSEFNTKLKHQFELLNIPYEESIIKTHSQYIYDNILKSSVYKYEYLNTGLVQNIIQYNKDVSEVWKLKNIRSYYTNSKAVLTPIVGKAFALRKRSSIEYSKIWNKHNVVHTKLICRSVWQNACRVEGSQLFYRSVKIRPMDLTIKVGDYVSVRVGRARPVLEYLEVILLWEENQKQFFHGRKFLRSEHTFLGHESLYKNELFVTENCITKLPLTAIVNLIDIKMVIEKDTWSTDGAQPKDTLSNIGFFCRKKFCTKQGRYEDLAESEIIKAKQPNNKPSFIFSGITTKCSFCQKRFAKLFNNLPRLEGRQEKISHQTYPWDKLLWKEDVYSVGGGVLLLYDAFNLPDYTYKLPQNTQSSDTIDDELYPELKRKAQTPKRNESVIPPFRVGIILQIFSKNTDSLMVEAPDIFLKVRVMYRPENHLKGASYDRDLNAVFWTEETCDVNFDKLVRPCTVSYKTYKGLYEWSQVDHTRFYFNYMIQDKVLREVSESIKNMYLNKAEEPEKVFTRKKLRMLDIFSGCGGLSEGLCKSGVAQCMWAIENQTAACKSFSKNHQAAMVFNDDVNPFLERILLGITKSSDGILYPRPGEVDIICGGPPCQGFSAMNRYANRENSQANNSLVATFLSYCDYYRPKYFILENVRNFVYFQDQMIVKRTIASLLEMGYQCAVGVLQSGQYGVPQSRRRTIILASAPGFKLPKFPEPTYVFSNRLSAAFFKIDDKSYTWCENNSRSAPRRMLTIRDAIEDLERAEAGTELHDSTSQNYPNMVTTHFQRMLRKDSKCINDHICMPQSALASARIALIPKLPGADWRDLPNSVVTLGDGTKTNILQYNYKVKTAKGDEKRGVCVCITGESCDPTCRQVNTIIPWCLPHTGDQNNDWGGILGRLSYDDFFRTIVTDPDSLRKQGTVIHPVHDRVISVREYARAQGFPDTYTFEGTLSDLYIQIGNAVPPPLAYQIGREIMKAYEQSPIID